MKLIIDIPEDMYNDANILIVKDLPELKKIIANGKPLIDVTYEQISDAFLNAIANYLEEKSKYLTPPPTPAQCHDCSNEIRKGTFVSEPIEVIKAGEPLSNSDVIRAATEKGELYRRGFKDAMKRYKRPTGELIKDEDGSIICSICETGTSIKSIPSVIFFRYCPYCGAELKRGDKV